MLRVSLILLLTSLCLPAAADDDEGTLWDRIEGQGRAEVSGSNGKSPPAPAAAAPDAAPEASPAEPADTGEEEVEEDTPRGPTTAELLLKVDRQQFDIPISYTPEVIKWVAWFTSSGRSTFRRWLSRSTRYKDLIQAELVQEKLPTDLLYLAMIESGFSVSARSHADAVGMWQFIDTTARAYDLRVDEHIDERRDPVLATRAATRYLRKLKNDFGNWYMAFASYNAGEGLVFRCIRAYGTINFWGLARIGALPDETSNYVPKLLAAATIAKNPELFGFTNIDYLPPLRQDSIEVNGGLLVEELAKSAALEVAEFLEYNPQILGDRLPEEPARQTIWLPPGIQRQFYASLHNQPLTRASDGQRIAVAAEPEPDLSHHVKQFTEEAAAAPTAAWVSHQVRRGESLASIARRYGCSVDDLQHWNGLEEGARPAAGHILWLKSAQ